MFTSDVHTIKTLIRSPTDSLIIHLRRTPDVSSFLKNTATMCYNERISIIENVSCNIYFRMHYNGMLKCQNRQRPLLFRQSDVNMRLWLNAYTG